MSQMYDNYFSCHTVMSCHKNLIFSSHVKKSCHDMSQMSDIQYSCHTVMTCQVTNFCYSILMLHSHVISQKFLVFSTHATQSFHVMSQMFNNQYTWHTVKSCHKYLIFSYLVTNISFTNFWYLVLMSHGHVMSCHKYLIFSTHVIQSCHVKNDW